MREQNGELKMKISFFRLPQDTSERTRNAMFVTMVYLIGGIVVDTYLTIQAIKAASWHSWTAALAVFVMVISSIVALILIRRARSEAGVWILMIGSYIAAFCIIAAVSGMGIVV